MMCTGMNPTSRSAPGISLASIDRGAIMAVTSPAARVARAPIKRRAISIGKVNVIASATLAYAGHDRRMIAPTTVTTVIHIASPATTPKDFFAMSVPLERSETHRPGLNAISRPGPIVGIEVYGRSSQRVLEKSATYLDAKRLGVAPANRVRFSVKWA